MTTPTLASIRFVLGAVGLYAIAFVTPVLAQDAPAPPNCTPRQCSPGCSTPSSCQDAPEDENQQAAPVHDEQEQADDAKPEEPVDTTPTSLAESLDSLRDAFNADSGKVRVIAILSPG